MTIGGRHFVMKRRWLALFSLAWMAAIYALWMLLNSPGAMLDHGRIECQAFDQTNPYAYAECLQFAAQTMNSRYVSVAETATLIAIVPVALLWMFWVATRFLQECRSADCVERSA